jgi:type IV pilus assembly protein PilY1
LAYKSYIEEVITNGVCMDLSKKIPRRFFPLLLAFTVLPASASELPYSSVPLTTPVGVQPNVAVMIDTSGSMGGTDTGGTGNITSVCNGATIAQPMTHMQAAEEAACQMAQDNASAMRIGLYRFDNGGTTGLRIVPVGTNSAATLKTAISGLAATGNTPLTSAMDAIVKDYIGIIGASSPIQYRCQKNYVVFFTDGG